MLKVDAEDHSKVLQGATFRLYFDNANRTFVRELQTDANGIARFDNLMLHMPYILEESAAPADYVRSDPYEWQIVLDPTEQDVMMQIENISLKSETLLGELGDYVWLDISRDGLQDEPREKGVNGVNVLLYEKEASGDYKWLETKTTGDEGGDPDRPGTYLFNQLLRLRTKFVLNGLKVTPLPLRGKGILKVPKRSIRMLAWAHLRA